MSKKIIQLYNRYGLDVHLEELEDDKWIFTGEDDAFEYHRVIFEKGHKELHAVDPSGGPYLCIGYVVEDKTVTSIKQDKEKGYIVTLKPLHNDSNRTES